MLLGKWVVPQQTKHNVNRLGWDLFCCRQGSVDHPGRQVEWYTTWTCLQPVAHTPTPSTSANPNPLSRLCLTQTRDQLIIYFDFLHRTYYTYILCLLAEVYINKPYRKFIVGVLVRWDTYHVHIKKKLLSPDPERITPWAHSADSVIRLFSEHTTSLLYKSNLKRTIGRPSQVTADQNPAQRQTGDKVSAALLSAWDSVLSSFLQN